MKITICLPRSTGFDVGLDDKTIHMKFENTTKMTCLKKGEHTIQVQDQAPVPTFWNSIMKFFNPVDNSVGDLSAEMHFTITQDVEVAIDIVYGDYQYVEFIPSELFSQVIIDSNDSFSN